MRRSYRKKSSMPMRYRYNIKKRINQSKAVTRLLKNVSETKVCPMLDVDEFVPGPTQVGATAYSLNFVVGQAPPTYSDFFSLQGVPAAGTGPTQFNGKSFYYKHSALRFRITTNAVAGPVPLRLRCVVYKPRRIAVPAGISPNPSTSLFQDIDGSLVGAGTSGITGTDLMLLNINKREFDVKHDFQFTLQPPGQQPDPGTDPRPQIQGVYPCDRIMKFILPIERKLFKDPNSAYIGTGTHWCVSMFADTTTRDGFASNWEVSGRGCTMYLDN